MASLSDCQHKRAVLLALWNGVATLSTMGICTGRVQRLLNVCSRPPVQYQMTGHASPYRLDKMDASTTEARAAKLLHGLGFNNRMQKQKTRDFSGGWRMRIALARSVAAWNVLLWLYLLERYVGLCERPLAMPAAWAHS